MDVKEFVGVIKKGVELGLPGEAMHKLLLPDQRDLHSVANEKTIYSAVVVLVNLNKQTPHITFIERAKYNGIHSGQIAFPGGKFEKSNDKTFVDTAIRETFEEIGYKIDKSQIVCELSNLLISVSNIVIYPFVAIAQFLPDLKPNSDEVDNIFSVPITEFAVDKIKTGVFKGDNYKVNAPYWCVNGKKIWGATAMIVAEFIGLLSNVNKNM